MDKMERVETTIRNMKSVLVAFSGGVDSTLLLYMASKFLGDGVVAATVVSPLMTSKEIEKARGIAELMKVRHKILDLDIFSHPSIIANPPQRCYHCKLAIFDLLKKEADRLGLSQVIDATQADDVKDFRPGMLALMELGIKSPMADAGMTKTDIRRYARIFNLPNAEEVSSPCLATRIPFKIPISLEALRRVEEAEKNIKRLGFNFVRVRDYFPVAVIEVPESEIERISKWPLRQDVFKRLQDCGYSFSAVELKGYRRGSQSEVLKEKEKERPII